MVRIFVTGDNHIGMKYASHDKAATLAAARLTAFEGMVASANAENCALFAITGDLFENTYSISKRDIKTLLDTLSRFQGTVVVLPGNHDYYDKDVRVWQHFEELLPSYDNVMLLTEYRPYPLTVGDEDVLFYPALCTSLHSAPDQNNLGWIKETAMDDPAAYHIGIAHGAVEGETIDNEGRYFLMKRAELESIPVDAWLIGHGQQRSADVDDPARGRHRGVDRRSCGDRGRSNAKTQSGTDERTAHRVNTLRNA